MGLEIKCIKPDGEKLKVFLGELHLYKCVYKVIVKRNKQQENKNLFKACLWGIKNVKRISIDIKKPKRKLSLAVKTKPKEPITTKEPKAIRAFLSTALQKPTTNTGNSRL